MLPPTVRFSLLAMLALASGCSEAATPPPAAKAKTPRASQEAPPPRPMGETQMSEPDLESAPQALRFGMSTALSGPAKALGQNMRDGFEAAFARANAEGGVAGKNLELVVLDDGYEPSRTAPNMHRLIDEEGVLAVVGNVGTPTAIAAVPIANEKRVGFFAAYTGAGVLRKSPADRQVINIRASYAEETAAMVEHLIGDGGLRPEEFAFFTQRDGYGDAGFSGGIAALSERGLTDMSVIAHGRYERNTEAVESGLATILQADTRPRAVIMVGAYAPCASFITTARDVGLSAVFLNVSFVGTRALAERLGKAGDGVIVTQVVPHPLSDEVLVREYREDLSSGMTASFGGVEGYLAGRVLVRALRQEGAEFDREGVIDALERLGEFDMGIGEPLRLSPKNHQAMHRVWPTMIRDGKAQPYRWAELNQHAALVK